MRRHLVAGCQLLLTLTSVGALVQSGLRRDGQLFVLSALAAVALGAFALGRLLVRRSPAVWRRVLDLRYGGPRTPWRRLAAAALRRAGPFARGDDALPRLAHASARSRWSLGRPLLAPARLLDRRGAWPEWAFSVSLTFEGVLFSGTVRDGRRVQRLEVELGAGRYGVYNNRGKHYLADRYRSLVEERAADLAQEAHALVLDDRGTQARRVGAGFPLRWASAGVLPVARRDGADWVVLFFRDIHPIGWNVANGASEDHAEQLNLAGLAEREFCEELLVLDGDPVRVGAPSQRQFAMRTLHGQPPTRMSSRAFSRQHRALRLGHDEVEIGQVDAPEHDAVVTVLPTPWEVVVTEPGRHGTRTLSDLVPSLNPEEFGIEFVRLLRFDLRDDDVLLDGEILERGPFLARRPVGLLRLEHLREVFAAGALAPTSRDRRLLPATGPGDVRVFTQDISLRRRRLRDRHLPTGERAYLEQWLAAYGTALGSGSLTAPNVRALCPATWKTLDAAFRRGVL